MNHEPSSIASEAVLQERAREQLARRYKSSRMAEDVLLTALYSISDNNSFLLFNRDPITRMIQYLKVCVTCRCRPKLSPCILGSMQTKQGPCAVVCFRPICCRLSADYRESQQWLLHVNVSESALAVLAAHTIKAQTHRDLA